MTSRVKRHIRKHPMIGVLTASVVLSMLVLKAESNGGASFDLGKEQAIAAMVPKIKTSIKDIGLNGGLQGKRGSSLSELRLAQAGEKGSCRIETRNSCIPTNMRDYPCAGYQVILNVTIYTSQGLMAAYPCQTITQCASALRTLRESGACY